MSLFDAAAELEYVPQDELIRLSQDPNSRFPQFLVLSEVQRRTQMRRMYENQLAKQNQPTMTVADEAVMELANQGAMPSEPSSQVVNDNSQLSPIGLSSMAPPEQPMRQMAEGGSTSDDSRIELKTHKAAAGGLLAIWRALQALNAVKKGTQAAKGTALIPYVAPKAGVMQRIKGGLRGISDWVKRNPKWYNPANLFTKMNPAGSIPLAGGLGTMVTGPARILSPFRTLSTLATGASLPFLFSGGADDETPKTKPQDQDQTFDTSVLEDLLNVPADYQPVNKRQQGQDLAKLGFAILASPNMQTLGENLYSMVDDMQKRGGTGLEKAQQAYYEAKVAELELQIAGKPYEDLIREYQAVQKAVEELGAQGETDTPEYISAITYLNALTKQLAEARGIDLEGSLVGGATVN